MTPFGAVNDAAGRVTIVLDATLVYQRLGNDFPDDHWEAYNIAEKLVDIEESFQLWRFRHMKTVERIIGFRRGTGGSSGVAFLRRALDLTFFPELFEVRTVLGEADPPGS